MLIPYNTDAPVYHFPSATIGLIVANVLLYLVTAGIAMNDDSGPDAAQPGVPAAKSMLWLSDSPKVRWLNLEFDKVLPTQWVTHAFMHADIFHLLGNMIFLWGFGLVVEGKVGWKRFLALYFVLCLSQGAFIQLLMFFTHTPGAALGASGAIFGLMAIAVVWAPQNEMNCLLLWLPAVRLIDMQIIVFGLIYLALQLLFFGLNGFQMSSEALHLTGMLIGAPIGVLFLRRHWVDCEGWDFHSVYVLNSKQLDRKRNERRNQEKKLAAREQEQERAKGKQRVLDSISSALDAGNDVAAIAIHQKFESELQAGRQLPTNTLRSLTSAMHRQQAWERSVPLLVEMLGREPPERSAGVRLRLAEILIHVCDRPRQGYDVLKKLPAELKPEQILKRNKLAAAAKAKLAEGHVEIEVHDW